MNLEDMNERELVERLDALLGKIKKTKKVGEQREDIGEWKDALQVLAAKNLGKALEALSSAAKVAKTDNSFDRMQTSQWHALWLLVSKEVPQDAINTGRIVLFDAKKESLLREHVTSTLLAYIEGGILNSLRGVVYEDCTQTIRTLAEGSLLSSLTFAEQVYDLFPPDSEQRQQALSVWGKCFNEYFSLNKDGAADVAEKIISKYPKDSAFKKLAIEKKKLWIMPQGRGRFVGKKPRIPEKKLRPGE